MSASLAEQIATLSDEERAAALDGLDPKALLHDWRFWGRPEQFAPDCAWNVWLILAGRGFGKTRAGAEWVIEMARTHPGCRIALVGRTSGDVTGVMIGGESGIMAMSPPDFTPHHHQSKRQLQWPNGSIAETFSAEEPDQIRGPQFHYAWADEAAAWKFVKDSSGLNAWDNLRIATRLGDEMRIVATTTPKRTPFMQELLDEAAGSDSNVVITRGSTYDNRSNMAKVYFDVMTGLYGGTRLGQQELMGIMMDAVEGALWDQQLIDDHRVPLVGTPPLRVVAVDPSVAENPKDECGIVVVGATNQRRLMDRHAYVLEDASVHGSPEVWAQKVIDTARKWNCPVVVEKNQGHALLALTLANIDPNVQVFPVQAYVGKALRAEPVTLAYDQGRVHHVGPAGSFPYLEAQQTGWVPGETRKSPDRLDALVHGVTALLIAPPRGFGAGGLRAKSSASKRLPEGRGSGTGRTVTRQRAA